MKKINEKRIVRIAKIICADINKITSQDDLKDYKYITHLDGSIIYSKRENLRDSSHEIGDCVEFVKGKGWMSCGCVAPSLSELQIKLDGLRNCLSGRIDKKQSHFYSDYSVIHLPKSIAPFAKYQDEKWYMYDKINSVFESKPSSGINVENYSLSEDIMVPEEDLAALSNYKKKQVENIIRFIKRGAESDFRLENDNNIIYEKEGGEFIFSFNDGGLKSRTADGILKKIAAVKQEFESAKNSYDLRGDYRFCRSYNGINQCCDICSLDLKKFNCKINNIEIPIYCTNGLDNVMNWFTQKEIFYDDMKQNSFQIPAESSGTLNGLMKNIQNDAERCNAPVQKNSTDEYDNRKFYDRIDEDTSDDWFPFGDGND